jgi:predicted RNase H-like nuclease (RuvC/YqgF family)
MLSIGRAQRVIGCTAYLTTGENRRQIDAEARVVKEREMQQKVIKAKDEQLAKLRETIKSLQLAAKELKEAKNKMEKELTDTINARDATIKTLEKMVEDRDGTVTALLVEKEKLQKQVGRLGVWKWLPRE